MTYGELLLRVARFWAYEEPAKGGFLFEADPEAYEALRAHMAVLKAGYDTRGTSKKASFLFESFERDVNEIVAAILLGLPEEERWRRLDDCFHPEYKATIEAILEKYAKYGVPPWVTDRLGTSEAPSEPG